MPTLASHLNMTHTVALNEFVMPPDTDGCGVAVVDKYSSSVSMSQAGTQKEPKMRTPGRPKMWLVLLSSVREDEQSLPDVTMQKLSREPAASSSVLCTGAQ